MHLTDTERRRLAVLAHPKPQDKPLGRPRVAAEIEQLVIRMATENPRWGYRRIQGALSNLGYHIDKTTVRNILRRHHIDPAPIRGKTGMSWSQFVTLHWEVLQATGFFATSRSRVVHLWTVVTQLARHLNTRGVRLLGLIRHSAISILAWVAQQYRTLWAGCHRHSDSQWRVAFKRRRRMPERVFPTRRLASSRQVARHPSPFLVPVPGRSQESSITKSAPV
jgi:hypothetical protein